MVALVNTTPNGLVHVLDRLASGRRRGWLLYT